MFSKSFDASVFLLSIPLTISFVVGITLVYFNHQRSIRAQKKLKSHFFQQVENEKIKISRELHDSISPFTIPLKEFIKKRGIFNEENNKQWLAEIERFETYLSNINNSIFPSELLEADLFNALEKISNRLSSDTAKIEVYTEVSAVVSKSNAIQVFRIIQESLINAIKHSQSEYITLLNTQKDNLLICSLSYETTSNHFEAYSKKSSRRGLKIINQRIDLISGKHEISKEGNIITEKFIFKDIFI